MKPLIIYHAECPDGFGAAYAAWRKWGEKAEYVPAEHGSYQTLDELEVDNRLVYILDFSFPRATLDEMAKRARSVIILDHHKTAKELLAGFPNAVFDMHKSGARLAWEHFHPTEPLPRMLECIEDRDLWAWRLPDAANALSYLDTLPHDFEVWDRAARCTPQAWATLVEQGELMQRKFMWVVSTVARAAEPVCFCGVHGHKVELGAASGLLASDVGHAVYEKSGTFAMLWSIGGGKLKVSLRSKPGIDAAKMAEQFGGGGHAGAAAFRLTLGTPECTAFMERYIFGNGEVA
ncbi:DHHA1 domain-containing protein [Paraburkholderia sp. EG287A]|uniref:DHHA1 domain-containing protein n=1 Tax=Paraburkholderia sp. EG287A TaxID=3237012 RepID=UPI0034D3254F